MPSLFGAVGFHVALLVGLAHESGAEPLASRAIAHLGVEVSLDAELEKSERGQKEDTVDPPEAVLPARAEPLHLPAGLSVQKQSSTTDELDSDEGVGPSEDSLPGLFGGSSIQGVSSATLRGIRRASLQGHEGSLRADRKARLALGGTACADLFPYEAGVSRGEVTATLNVDPNGRAKLVKLEQANPTARGFEAAASVCAKRLRFEPARDGAGRTVASTTQVKLVFQRDS